MIKLPSPNSKKWVTGYKGDYLGDIINAQGIDLFSSPSKVKVAEKFYPHTTGTVSGTAMSPVSSFITAKINDGTARVLKTWAVSDSKMITRSEDGVAFVKDTSTGIPAGETTGLHSDIVAVPDDTEDTIVNTQLSIPAGSGAVAITGTGNNTRWAQKFTQVQGPFKKFSVYIRSVGILTDNLIIDIQSDNAGIPSGTSITSITLDAARFESDFTLYEYKAEDWSDPTVQFDLDAIYHVVFSRSGSADTDNFVEIQTNFIENDPDVDDEAEDPYGTGDLQQYNGSTWSRVLTYIKTDTYTADGVFIAPSGVTTATVQAFAAGGSGSTNVGAGGGGAYSEGVFTVTPSNSYGVQVGLCELGEDGTDSIFGGESIDVLVVGGGGAGGGSGGSTHRSGGGGAGGQVIETTSSIAPGSYPVVVGIGGDGDVNPATDGGFSKFQNFKALGGSFGGRGAAAGGDGYNGGGSGTDTISISGGDGSNFDGGAGFGNGGNGNNSAGGGGAGASSNGSAGTSATGGNGGAGINSSISGSSVNYGAGGGGGGATAGGAAGGASAGAGGTAGGVDAPNNRGGGGGGGNNNGVSDNGGEGGSGVVIIRYLTGAVTATGGTVTTSGPYTIHTFTSSGTFTVTATSTSVELLAKGGLSGANGGTGGQASSGIGTIKYSGGNGGVGTGDRSGGGGAGTKENGGNGGTGLGGKGGEVLGGYGGGVLNGEYTDGGSLYGGGGNSKTSSRFAGARGEVRVSYPVTESAGYPMVAERFSGAETSGTSHPFRVPTSVQPGDLILLIVSSTGDTESVASGYTQLSTQTSSDSLCNQTILWKRATGNDSGNIGTSSSTSISWVGYRIINAGDPTATQVSNGTTGDSPDSPSHNTFEVDKYLWVSAGTFGTLGGAYSTPTAPPNNYSSLIIQPTIIPNNDGDFLAPRTMVAERLLEDNETDPGAFVGGGASVPVAATIAVPYKAQSFFADLSMAIQVEFPQSFERIYITTDKDIKFLGEEDTIWQSLWMGVYQQEPLESGVPHPMKLLSAGGVLIVGDGHKLHTMVATGTNVTEAQPNRLVFDSNYYINWIDYTKSAVFIGLANRYSENMPSLVCYYEPNSEITRIFTIKEGATIGFIVDENCYLLDKKGQMRYFNGSAFPSLGEPANFPPYFLDRKITLPHRNGIYEEEGKINFLWNGDYPYSAGVWVLEGGRLYHKNPFVYDGVALNSYGAIDTPSGWGALYNSGDHLYAGATLYGTNNSTEVKGIYSTTKTAATTVESEGRGYIKTPKFPSDGIDSIWQRVYSKSDDRPSGLVNGEIVLKYRQESSAIGEGVNAPSYAGTWTSATTFTTTDSSFRTAVDNGNIVVGDEVIIRRGQGSGLRATIQTITGTTTRTVTIDSGLSDITSGSMNFSVENWKYIQNRDLVGTNSDWIQLKAEIRDSVELEELQITYKSNESNEE